MDQWKSVESRGIVLLTVAAAVGFLADQFTKTHPTSTGKSSIFVFVAIVATSVGIALCGVVQLKGILLPVWRWALESVTGRIEAPHFRKYAGVEDIPTLQYMYEKEFKDDAPSLELMNSWFSKCSKVFVMVYRKLPHPNAGESIQLIGSFKFVPLSRSGVHSLEFKLVTGSTFRADDICTKPERAAAYYIGDVVSTGMIAGGHVLEEIIKESERYSKRRVTFYARPLTKRGLNVMQRRGFCRVGDQSRVFMLGDLCKISTTP